MCVCLGTRPKLKVLYLQVIKFKIFAKPTSKRNYKNTSELSKSIFFSSDDSSKDAGISQI